jgi:hypothetical protein
MSRFLTDPEVRILTGRAHKGAQIDQLRRMGIPFFINAAGRPVVTTSAVEGKKEEPMPKTWTPRLVNGT